MSGSVGFGIAIQTPTQVSDSGNGGFFGRLDFQAFHPLWLTVRARFQPLGQVDTLVGWSIRHFRGETSEEIWRPQSETSTTRTYSISSNELVGRKDTVIALGVKSTFVGLAQAKGTEPNPIHLASILQGGAQLHFATEPGSHKVMEAYLLYNPTTKSPGIQAQWHNSIENDCLNSLVFGMEAGYVPATDGAFFSWAIVEFGWSFEL